VIAIRRLLLCGAVLALDACAQQPVPNPASVVMPGPGKDAATFQVDDSICRQHAAAGTGYGDLAPQPAPKWNVPVRDVPNAQPTQANALQPPEVTIPNQQQYLQCMAARGNAVAFVPPQYGAADNWDGYPYPYDWAYSDYYLWPYGFYSGGFIAVFGNGFHGGQFHRRFFHDGASFHTFARHGGFAHGGFAHAGHMGGPHGGGFHGGGGHR
jgi:hypothetical protein